VGEVFIKVDFGKTTFIGKGASLDIVDASARAYLDAFNKLVHYQAALAEDEKNAQSR
jgi:2-isopropylmalate synthase